MKRNIYIFTSLILVLIDTIIAWHKSYKEYGGIYISTRLEFSIGYFVYILGFVQVLLFVITIFLYLQVDHKPDSKIAVMSFICFLLMIKNYLFFRPLHFDALYYANIYPLSTSISIYFLILFVFSIASLLLKDKDNIKKSLKKTEFRCSIIYSLGLFSLTSYIYYVLRHSSYAVYPEKFISSFDYYMMRNVAGTMKQIMPFVVVILIPVLMLFFINHTKI